MKQYLDLLQHILDHGVQKGDRTGTGTLSVFGYQMRFDLQKGFPAVTTKKLAWKSVVSELLWFIEGSNDERRLAEILYGTRDPSKRTIWTDNLESPAWASKATFPGDLQKIYGYQWRKWDNYKYWKKSVVLIKKNTTTGINLPFHLDIPIEEVNFTDADDFVGQEFDTNQCGRIRILEKLKTRNNNSYYRAQFLEGINAIVECSRPNIKSKTIKNPYAMTVANNSGCFGIISKKSKYYTTAYNMWLNMMERCHGVDPIKTIYYKNKGVFVDQSWRCFANFYRDIHGLVGFDQWAKSPSNFDLDKDYFCSNYYGQKTTLFLPSWYNMYILPKVTGELYTAQNKKTQEIFKFTSPAFFNQHTKTSGMVDRAFLNQKGKTRIWEFSKDLPPDGFVWRQQFFVDQLANLITGIKKDPDGRRHIITAWQPGELSQMALPPCHCLAQFYVADGRLSCQLYQRSGDSLLGIPFNIASYALFTHMIAQVCDLRVGEFIHTLGDAHIYNNHLNQVKEQLSRTPLSLPKLAITQNVKDIEAFTMSDFELIDYQFHPPIKAKMAV